MLNQTLDASVLQSQATDLNLATGLRAPLGDTPYLLARLAGIERRGGSEASLLAALAALTDWDAAAPSGFFDKLGTGVMAGKAPRLVVGEGAYADPSFFFTSHQQALGMYNWGGSKPNFTDGAAGQAPAEWGSFSSAQSQGGHPLTLEYAGLDPAARYRLRILFFKSMFKQFQHERNTIRAGSTVLQLATESPLPMRPVVFAVPMKETQDRELTVTCTSPTSRPFSSTAGCSIVAVWLELDPTLGGNVQ